MRPIGGSSHKLMYFNFVYSLLLCFFQAYLLPVYVCVCSISTTTKQLSDFLCILPTFFTYAHAHSLD